MATSAVSSDSLPVAPPASSCLDKISSLAKIIYECAVRIIFIATSILITAYLFPVGFHAVVLPVVGLSSTITSAFFFRKSSTRSGEISNPPPLMRPLALPPGLEREGNNCAFNSVIHAIQSLPEAYNWINNPFPDNRNAFTTFVQNYGAPQGFIDSFFNNYPQNQALSIHQNFINYVNLPGANDPLAITEFREKYKKLAILKPVLQKIFTDYEHAQNGALWALSPATSQSLRVAISQCYQGISSNSSVQEDAHEIMTQLLGVLPADHHIQFEEITTYDLTGRPPILDGNSVNQKQVDETEVKLVIQDGALHPNLQQMLDGYCKVTDELSRRADDGTPNGTPTLYPRTTTLKFKNSPPALNIQIKRTVTAPPAETWQHYLFPRFFAASVVPRQVKNTTPVNVPDTLSIEMQDGSHKTYRLTSFMQHLGSLANGGHHVAGRIINGQKYIMNDQYVSPVDQSEWERSLQQAHSLCYLLNP